MKECSPREGLPHVFHKLENGEEVTVRKRLSGSYLR